MADPGRGFRKLPPVSDQVVNGLIATVLGIGVAVLLLVPTAAVQYRRDGRLGVGDLTVLVTAAVYGLALWTYTLLPFPTEDDFTCKHAQLELLGSFRPLFDRGLMAPGELVRDAAFLQLALNVLLFVPLGFFVRLVVHRGVVVTTVLGFVISLTIETTQLTGVWGLYDCAYRLFDVDDLVVNTAGALVGGLLAWVFVHRRHVTPVVLPTHITLGRRWVGFVCDVLFMVLTGTAAAIAWRGWNLYGRGIPYDEIDDSVTRLLQLVVPLVPEALLVLLAGRTVGEWVISVGTTTRHRWLLPARLLKLVLGVGGFNALLLLDFPGAGTVLLVLVLATLGWSLRTREHRGLTHWAAGMDLRISR